MKKEEKKQLAKLHDEFAKHYNEYIDAVGRLVCEHAEEFTEEERVKIIQLNLHSKLAKQHINAMDAILSDLGCFHRFYKIADHVRKEVAMKPLMLS